MVKAFALQILGLQEDVSAHASVLVKRGMTHAEFSRAQQEMRSANQARRERIEKLDPTNLDDFLKGFQGPLQ